MMRNNLASSVVVDGSQHRAAATRTTTATGRPAVDRGRKASRLFLYAALVWPVFVYVASLMASSSDAGHYKAVLTALLDRYEVVGYGPAHPRVVVVTVADATESDVMRSVSSVFAHTDRNRLLAVCVVVNGLAEDAEAARRLKEDAKRLDGGGALHWHGMFRHVHGHDEDQRDHQQDSHGRKIHLLFNGEKRGVAASRAQAAQHLDALIDTHEQAGLKHSDEDIILLFLRPDVALAGPWLAPVTAALIVPPVSPTHDDPRHDAPLKAAKLANAVSFAVDTPLYNSTPGQTTSFDMSLRPLRTVASAKDMAQSNGESYPTPLLTGAATAMRLNTFLQFPGRDLSLDTHFASDVEMSFNLWLCADGIDVLPVVRAIQHPSHLMTDYDRYDMDVDAAARLAVAWMPTPYHEAAFAAVAKRKGVKPIDLIKVAMEVKKLPNFPSSLDTKCRPFKWYAEEINTIDESVEHLGRPIKQILTEDQINDHSTRSSQKQAAEARRLPLKPLRLENKEIVSKTHPVDLAYVDVTDGFIEHPHRGARNENGEWGYVHDETNLRSNPPEFRLQNEDEVCGKKDANWKMLTQKVFVDMDAHEAAEREHRREGGKKERIKIFCLVYTIEKNHYKLPTIRETWGQKCDGFLVASDKTDNTLDTVDIPHDGPEEYDNIWQKVRSIWSYVYDNYYDKYDYFHIGGDDLYLLVENLRLYLESEEIRVASNGGIYLPTTTTMETYQTPLFLGRRFAEQGNMERIFNSGGSGYTINRAALKSLVVTAFPSCMPHLRTFSEDVMVAQCLRSKINVYPYDTKDEEGGERYMPFQPGHHLTYTPPEEDANDWYMKYSINIKYGFDHCAAQAVAFHYISDNLMKRMHAILYGYCPKG